MKEKKVVVGFWLRFLADFLDALMLAIVGALISWPFRSVLFSIGENGLWLGLCITFAYTGIMHSNICKGQTLAKKILKIQVVRMDGSYLSLPRSFLRYVTISLIFYNHWIGMAFLAAFPSLNNAWFAKFYSYTIFVLILGTISLVVFHPLKRGIHDLIAGSIVVRKDLYSEEKISQLNNPSRVRFAFGLWAILCVLIIGALTIVEQKQMILHKDQLKELSDISEKIKNETGFINVGVGRNWYKKSDGQLKSGIGVAVFMYKKDFDNEKYRVAEMEKAVDIIIASYTKIAECEFIKVQVSTGFNIGIWSEYYKHNYKYGIDGKSFSEKVKRIDLKFE